MKLENVGNYISLDVGENFTAVVSYLFKLSYVKYLFLLCQVPPPPPQNKKQTNTKQQQQQLKTK